ncbi:MAG: mechanosensitive ion channel family protein [Sulfurimonas sp.]|nr:mechanosensitive ion channel family protein [Sulfurimonas sp.]
MLSNILASLDDADNTTFSKKLNQFITQNQVENELLNRVDYKKVLQGKSSSKSLTQAKQNIKEFYALIDINVDVINYLYMSEHKMYRLNKYSKYNLIGAVLILNNSQVSRTINPILENYGLNIVKLLSIAFLIILIFAMKKILYYVLEKNISNIESSPRYSKEILHVMRSPLGRLILVININMIVYVYNDFNSIEIVAKFFNMIYAAIFTFIVFKVVNVVAKIKVHEIENNNEKIKNDLINVGIKILNFIILILGILIVLHFAGANLTAVLSGLGIGGFAVALAAKDSLANFFGTLSILFSDVFAQGDWIVVEDKEGVVIEIGTRVTTLRTFDNALIAIPNAILANQGVKNWNKRNLGRRIKMNLGIKYGSSSADIKNTVNEIRAMLDMHEDIATENTAYKYKQRESTKLVSKDDALGIKKTLLVYLDEFADSSMNILVYCFTKSTDWQDWLQTKEEVMHRIMEIFEKNNIEFAFPSLSIYHENEK